MSPGGHPMTLSVLVTQVAVVQLPWAQALFTTVALSPGQWATCVMVSTTILVAEEGIRLASRRHPAMERRIAG